MSLETALAELNREAKRREKLAHLFPCCMHAIVFSEAELYHKIHGLYPKTHIFQTFRAKNRTHLSRLAATGSAMAEDMSRQLGPLASPALRLDLDKKLRMKCHNWHLKAQMSIWLPIQAPMSTHQNTPDTAVLTDLGARLAHLRLQRNLTQ